MKRLFARLDKINDVDRIVEIIQEFNNIDDEFHPDFVAKLIEITELDPLPEARWVYVDGKFSPPPPIEYTPAQRMESAAYTGCNIVSTENPDLSARYFAWGTPWQQMRDQVLYIVSFGEFSGGMSELHLPVHDDKEVIFTNTDDFKRIVKAIGDWLTMWQAYVNGKMPNPPDDPVKIS